MARSFDGADDVISFPDHPNYDADLGNRIAFSFFILPTTLTQTSAIVNKRTAFNDSNSYAMGFGFASSPRFDVEIGTSDGTGLTAAYKWDAAGWSISDWNHIVVLVDGDAADGQRVKLYRNGSLQAVLSVGDDLSFAGIFDGANPLLLGRVNESGSLFYDGKLAEVAFWSRLLNDSEIGALASGVSPFRIGAGSLKFYDPVRGNGATEPDLSGSGNNGSITGTTAADHPPVMPELLWDIGWDEVVSAEPPAAQTPIFFGRMGVR